jgi:DNA-directed RNA polymerase subunit RPC12/RpoP
MSGYYVCSECGKEIDIYDESNLREFEEPDLNGGFNLHTEYYCFTCGEWLTENDLEEG